MGSCIQVFTAEGKLLWMFATIESHFLHCDNSLGIWSSSGQCTINVCACVTVAVSWSNKPVADLGGGVRGVPAPLHPPPPPASYMQTHSQLLAGLYAGPSKGGFFFTEGVFYFQLNGCGLHICHINSCV